MHHVACAVSLLVLAGFHALATAAPKAGKAPDGVKVASGSQFDIYVEKKESSPSGVPGNVLNVFSATVVVHKTKRPGRQLFSHRATATNADLLDPAMWQVGDFDGDGFDDFRSVAYLGKTGCRSWRTQTWLPGRERFTYAEKTAHQTDARGKPVQFCK